MKVRFDYIKNGCAIGAMLIFLIALHVATVYVCTIKQVITDINPTLSPQGVFALTQLLSDPTWFKHRSIKELAHALHAKYPYIERIIIKQTPDQTAHAHISLHTPWLNLLTTQHVLTHNNSIMPKTFIPEHMLHKLTRVTTTLIDPETAAPDAQLIALLHAIDPAILTRSTITCNHLHELRIRLHDEPIELICNHMSLPTMHTIAQCRKIKDELAADARFDNGICADIRFCNQLIVSSLQSKEVIHG